MGRAVLLLIPALAHCGSTCGGAPIVAVEVLPPSSVELEIDLGSAESWVQRAAGRLDGYAVRPAQRGEPGWQLTVAFRLAVERSDETDLTLVRRALGAEARLERLDRPPTGEVGVVQAEALETRSVPRGSPASTQVEALLERLFERLATAVGLARAPPDALTAAVEDPDPHVRAVAVGLVRQRSLAEAAPALARRLADPEISTQDVLRIGGALGDVGGPASVGAVIDAVGVHPGATIPLLFVLGKLGGREAAGYLFTVERGHAQPDVRSAARDALEDLQARQRPVPPRDRGSPR